MFSSSTNESDLVALGILPKPISEFTNDDIGTEILIPYNDVGGVISGPIVFEVVGVNHHTNSEHQQTITLMTKDIIRAAVFDAKEPNNPFVDGFYTGSLQRAKYGNNRWSVSNIRQWLNSSGAANSWFTPQHEYDEAPTTDKVSYDEAATYADEPGFLAGFSSDVLQHFTDITNTTALWEFLVKDEVGTETTVDKVFLPSLTEITGRDNAQNLEGQYLSIRFSNGGQYKNGVNECYWLRSANSEASSEVRHIDGGGDTFAVANDSNIGIAPLIVLH